MPPPILCRAVRLGCLLTLAMVATGVPFAAPPPGAPDAPKDFVWRVRNTNGTVYLAGSLHELRARNRPSLSLHYAYAQCDRIVLEADLGEFERREFRAEVTSRAALPSGSSLAGRLEPATRAALRAIARRHQLPEDEFERFQPWFASNYASLLLLAEAGFDGNHGTDRYFFDRAVREGKPLEFLESGRSQLDLLTRIPESEALHALKQDLAGGLSFAEALVRAWESGDADQLARLVAEDAADTPIAFHQLLTLRNQTWLPRIEGWLRQTNCTLVLVGAAHLVGTNGLIPLLEARGHSVAQLPLPSALRPVAR